jgi:hypothetical protein
MAILDDLEGFLGADAVATLKANPQALEKFTKVDEVYDFYTGDSNTPPTPAPRREAPPTTVRPATDSPDLASILGELKTVTTTLGGLDDRIKTTTNSIIEERGKQLIGAAMANSRELMKIDNRNRAEFGTELDDAALEAHAAAAAASGRPFRTITDAYEDMTRKAREDKTVDSRVREELKTRNSGQVPGVSAPAATPMLSVLKGGNRQAGDAGSKFDAAASALRARQAERGEVAV